MEICPFVSTVVPVVGTYDQPTKEVEWVDCQRKNCALWVRTQVVRDERPEGFIEGCAFAMTAKRDDAHSVHMT